MRSVTAFTYNIQCEAAQPLEGAQARRSGVVRAHSNGRADAALGIYTKSVYTLLSTVAQPFLVYIVTSQTRLPK